MHLQESLGTPFYGELHLISADAATTADLLGQPATLTLLRDESERTFRGEVSRVELAFAGDAGVHARVRFEPRLARAARITRYRIFQDVGVVDIAREVFRAFDLATEVACAKPWPPRDYCVQYGESDLAFISRLLNEEGLTWFIDDSDERQCVRICQSNGDFAAIAGDDPELPVIADRFDVAETPSLQAIAVHQRIAAPAVVERTWQWLSSSPQIGEQITGPETPWEQTQISSSRRWAFDTLVESAELEYQREFAQDVVGRGRSNVTALAAGSYFTCDLGGDDLESLLLVHVEHTGDCPDAELIGGAATTTSANYTNAFTCHPLSRPYRPPPAIPRPKIAGVHTAVVTGPEGEEIYTDQQGRIRVRMHWDRSDTAPQMASCWLRVAQMWAGAGWGSLFLPRVGMEVLVSFVDGDPDRPICTGCVYNGHNVPPYALPDERTKSTIKTSSSPGGGGSNELRFEDAAGHEEVFIHAQKDLKEVVRNARSRSVGASEQVSIGRDQTLHVKQNRTIMVDGAQSTTIKGADDTPSPAHNLEVQQDSQVKITGKLFVQVDESITVICGDSTITMDTDGIYLQGAAASSLRLDQGAVLLSGDMATVALDKNAVVATRDASRLDLDAKATLTSQNQTTLVLDADATTTAASGAVLALTDEVNLSGAKATVIGDSASLVLDSSAATLTGTEAVLCDGASAASVKVASAAIDILGPEVKITGMAQVSVSGPMVKIN